MLLIWVVPGEREVFTGVRVKLDQFALFPSCKLKGDVGKGIRLKPAKLASPCLLFNIYLTSSSFRKAQKHVFNNKHVQMC